jgi:DNA polymerase-1
MPLLLHNPPTLESTAMLLPNIREMFVPDPDYVIFEADLKGADAQVVAWEANDEPLKTAFRENLDVHVQNMRDLFERPAKLHTLSPKEIKDDPVLNKYRQKAKVGVHATNYGCKERTLASHLKITVGEAVAFQETWFEKHPGILEWHRRTERQLQTTRTVFNRFGYRRQYFDRIDAILPEALAWVPQSTVALCINKGWHQLEKSGLPVTIMMQVHDSIIGQFHRRELEANPQFPTLITETMQVTIPYEDPLTIPVSISISSESWGKVKEFG